MTANGCRGAVRTDHQQPRLPFCPRSAAWPGMACCSKWRTARTRSNDEGRGLRQTGTLTETRPRVTDLIVDRRVVNFLSEPDASAVALLQLVGAGRGQIRALAQTIVTESKQRGQVSEECAAFNPLLAKARAAL